MHFVRPYNKNQYPRVRVQFSCHTKRQSKRDPSRLKDLRIFHRGVSPRLSKCILSSNLVNKCIVLKGWHFGNYLSTYFTSCFKCILAKFLHVCLFETTHNVCMQHTYNVLCCSSKLGSVDWDCRKHLVTVYSFLSHFFNAPSVCQKISLPVYMQIYSRMTFANILKTMHNVNAEQAGKSHFGQKCP